jgi:pyruvoyl-dependent arginine decarboxylase (PvlArgDC)
MPDLNKQLKLLVPAIIIKMLGSIMPPDHQCIKDGTPSIGCILKIVMANLKSQQYA